MTIAAVSVDEVECLNDYRDQIATALGGIVGLRIVTSPASINPPCAFVGVPRVTRVQTLKKVTHVDVELTVELIAPGPVADDRTVRWILANVIPAMRVTNAREAFGSTDPTTGELQPAYVLTIRDTLRIDPEEGS